MSLKSMHSEQTTQEPSRQEHYSDYTVKWATLDWELEQAFALRRQVFCGEQGIFEKDDRDEVDDYAQLLVAVANRGGWHEKIVGTVRIHNEGPRLWWGSRLAVDQRFRAQIGLGGVLIKLAVSSANALGCDQFFAQVQKRNEKLFQRLNWESKFELPVKDHPHVMMEANLDEFPPCYQPKSGFVIKGPRLSNPEDFGLPLLYPTHKVTDQTGEARQVA